MADCPSHAELEEFLIDRLPAESDSRVLTHLESCRACQQILEGLTSGALDGGRRPQMGVVEADQDEPGGEGQSPLPSRIGQYTVIRELGHGGMGVVYLAEQAKLKRLVALKVIRHGVNATAAEVSRFCAEAEAVGRLQHPNIVQIHEVGAQGGVYYLALEYVDGGSLDKRLAGNPQEPRSAAQLVETLARAVHHAHRRGILHRDLKPANILLSSEWLRPNGDVPSEGSSLPPYTRADALVPKIADFGLAKRLEPGELRTQSGLILGTPSYMAPEQASGRSGEVTHAVDVYGLGALLYEMLTGRPPFKGATPLSTLEQVSSHDPVAPSRFHRQIPRDLETICLKCLEKQPGKRYASAEDLADDLGRFLTGQPILARPVSPWGRARKWAQRRPFEACLAGTVLAVAVLGLMGILWKWRDALVERDKARQRLYLASMVAAASALQMHNSPAARRILEGAPEEYRKWEWRHFTSALDDASRVLLGNEGPMLGVAFNPSGDRLASLSEGRTLRLWDAATGHVVAVIHERSFSREAMAFSPDGRLLASGGEDGTVWLLDAETGAPLRTCRGHSGPIRAVAFSPDGRRLVTASSTRDDRCRLWESSTGALLAVLSVQTTDTRGLLFSPDGRRIVCCRDETIPILDAGTGREIMTPLRGGRFVHCCAVSPDGRRLVVGCDYPDNTVRLWDLASGTLPKTLTGHVNQVASVAFSPDGTRIVTASQDQTVRLWDAVTGQRLATLTGHTSHVGQAVFNPDGSRVVTASADGTLRLWDPSDGALISVLQGHSGKVSACAYSPDGTWLASASSDHTVRLWDMAMVERNGALRGHEGFVYDVAFSPDGVHVASAAWDNSVRIWDVSAGRQTGVFPGPGRRDPGRRRSDQELDPPDQGAYMLALAFSPDGRQLVAGSRQSHLQFWDVLTERLRRTVRLPGRGIASLAFSPDGKRVAVALGTIFPDPATDSRVYILDAERGETRLTLNGHTEGLHAVRFAPDGRRLASGGFDRTVRVWDARTGATLDVLPGHGDDVNAVAFSHDGHLLASASRDHTIRLWDTRKLGLHPPEILPHSSIVYAVAFSPDDTRLAAGCEDNTIRLWDMATRQEVAELHGHKAYVHALAFSPDGRRLVSASGDFTLRVWDTVSPAEMSRRKSMK